MPYKDKSTKILDFGCGEGAAVNYFNNIGFQSYGYDARIKMINNAKKLFPKSPSSYFNVPLDTLKINSLNESFSQYS